MANLIEKIKIDITNAVESGIKSAQSKGTLPNEIENLNILIDTPKDKQFGDFSCNIAMLLSKQLKMPPRTIATAICDNIENNSVIEKTEVAGAGFINFYLNNSWLYEVLSAIETEGEDYGKIKLGNEKIMVEFVSANPTGPMHMGNARGGALGDCMANVLEYAGYDVTREFYVNDAGNQIERFGYSLEARYMQALNGEDSYPMPEDGYQGDDIITHANDYIKENGNKLVDLESEERRNALINFALEKNINKLKSDLEKYRIEYDIWFRESSLYKSGEIDETLSLLKNSGVTYEKDGALWLDAISMGSEKDEVLVRGNGVPTYFAADIAYHRNKFIKRGYDRVIDIWGADHHGHVARMKGAMDAVGVDSNRLEIVIMQLVRLMQNNEVVRMSKRTGKSVTLSDLLEDTSVDAARFFFNMRSAGSHLDFDLDLAVSESSDNPVYYVQYAHARICSVINIMKDENISVPPCTEVNFNLLKQNEETNLLRKLCELPEEIKISAQTLEPARLTRYVIDLSTMFHSFYNACRIKNDDHDLMLARLKLVDSVRIVIRNVLELLEISAPEKM